MVSAVQRIRCPNCGDFAGRQVLSDRPSAESDYVVKTAYEACDYLLIMGFLETYAPCKASSTQPVLQGQTDCCMKPQTSTGKMIQALKQMLLRTC